MERIQAQMGEGRVEIEGLEIDTEVSRGNYVQNIRHTVALWLTGTGDQLADTSLDTSANHLWISRHGDGSSPHPELMVCSSIYLLRHA